MRVCLIKVGGEYDKSQSYKIIRIIQEVILVIYVTAKLTFFRKSNKKFQLT